MSKNIAIAYCADNQSTVQGLTQKLSQASYNFKHYSCTKTTSESSLSDQLLDCKDPILLIISDNFLKSAQCMSRALKIVQTKGEQMLSVVIPGVSKKEDGTISEQSTNFDRVSDIIQYINYWQDQYLDLRRQKRQMEDLDEEKFNAHLKVMRDISSEVGEFLRMLRNSRYASIEDFSKNQFENFFAFTQDSNGWELYKSLNIHDEPSPVEVASEEPTIDLKDIPGVHLLDEEAIEEKIEAEVEVELENNSDAKEISAKDIPFELTNETTPIEETEIEAVIEEELASGTENEVEAEEIE